MSGVWLLESGTWGCLPGGGFALQKSEQGLPVSSALSSDDIAWLCNAFGAGDGGRTAVHPPEFNYSPDSGKKLHRVFPANGVQAWVAPSGQPVFGSQPAPPGNGLRQTSSSLAMADRRLRAPDADADRTIAPPPPGNYQFFSAPFGTSAPALLAVDPVRGQLYAWAPASEKWLELHAAQGALLAECRLPTTAWRGELSGDGRSRRVFLPTNDGLVMLRADVPSLTYQTRTIGSGRAVAGALWFQGAVWQPLEQPDGTILFVSADADGNAGETVSLARSGLSGFSAPVTYGRAAVWPCDQGQVCLQKQSSGSVTAMFFPWGQGIEARFDFGSPYLSSDGELWQLCFDSTANSYVYTRLGVPAGEYEMTSSPRFCSGKISYRLSQKVISNPWEEPEHGDDSGTAIIIPLLESALDKAVIGIRLETSSGLEAVLDTSERQRVELCLDDAHGTTRFFTFSVPQPWLARLFIHDHQLWFYHPQLHSIQCWRLER